MIITGINPANDTTGVALKSPIRIIFDAVVDETTIENSITITQMAYVSEDTLGSIQPFTESKKMEYEYSVDNTNGYSILTLVPKDLFDKSRRVRVIIMNTLLDENGDPLDKNYISYFVTTSQDIINPPEEPSTTIGVLPDLNDIFESIDTSNDVSQLFVTNTYPEDETWGYDNVDTITFTFNENIDISNYVIQFATLNLDTLERKTLEENVDFITEVLGQNLIITLFTPISEDNTKILIKLKNIVSTDDSTHVLKSYSYEFVTNFNPIYTDVSIALSEAAALSTNDSYYLMHIIFYASKEAQLLTSTCTESDKLTYYKQKWVLAKVIKDLLSKAILNIGGLFTSEKTIAYVTIQRKMSDSLVPEALKIANDDLKRYELPLLTCGEAFPDAHLAGTSALIYANSKNVMQSGRLKADNNTSLAANTLEHAEGNTTDYFVKTYVRNKQTFTSDRNQ